jgi:hypothetical protein
LSIAPWMRNGCVTDLDTEVFAILLKYSDGELGPIVSDDPIWDPEPVDD